MSQKNRNRKKYYIDGVHCVSCEILIEKELTNHPKVKDFKLAAGKKEIEINFHGRPFSIAEINQLFSGKKYVFSEKPFKNNPRGNLKDQLVAFGIALLLIVAFLFLNKSGAGSLSLTVGSSLFIFFVFGVVASFSSCAALVGGIVLSMSKQWHLQFGGGNSFMEKIKPHLLFNLGRIASFVLLGFLLGIIGSKLQISLSASSVFVIVVSLVMIFFGFQMLGVNLPSRLGITAPKFVKKYIIEKKIFKSQKAPFALGALTVFLPCGFTVTVQGIALLSGSAFSGVLAMLVFVLGTTPALLAIGVSSVKFYEKPSLAKRFSSVAGILVLFFAVFNINAQLNVLGYPSFSDIKIASEESKAVELAKAKSKNSPDEYSKSETDKSVKMVEGKQVLRMEVNSRGYSPNSFQVKVGVPVRWEITDTGTSGCTNAVIAKELFDGEIALTRGKTSVKEFTPTKVGTYKFSCWMGMVSGTIKVVEES